MTTDRYDEELIIEPARRASRYWRDLWQYRELFFFLSWRDVLVRYKQTVIGVTWSVLRPFLTMVVFTLIFSKLAHFPSEGVPYPILVFAAMLPWQLFANALTESSSSLVNNANLLSKVYFPRLIVPVSAVIVSLVDFMIAFVLLGGMMLWYGVLPGWRILFLPGFLLLALLVALGMGVWLAALNVRYRDFRHIVPFVVQFGLYISPVGFSSAVVPDKWRLLYSLNPMVGVIDGFRWTLLGGGTQLYLPGLALSVFLSILFLWFGLDYFRKSEQAFADVI